MNAVTAIAPYIDIVSHTRPALSADGRHILFLSDAGGTQQIWERAWPDGSARQLTDQDEPVGAFAVGPADAGVLFTTDCGGDERHQLWLWHQSLTTPICLTPSPTTVHVWGCWSPDGSRIAYASNARSPTDMDIHVMEVGSRRATCVLQGQGYRDPLAFYPDGASLLVRDSSSGPHDQTLWRLDLACGQSHAVLAHDGRAEYRAARMRRDGTGFYILTDQDDDRFRIGFVPSAGAPIDWLVQEPTGSIEALALSPDQSELAYVGNIGGLHTLHLRAIGEPAAPASGLRTPSSAACAAVSQLPPGILGAPIWPADGAGIVFAHEGPAHAPGIWRADLTTLAAQAWECADDHLAHLPAFVQPTLIHAESFDGLPVPCFVYRPDTPPPPAGYPVLVIVHGGPAMAWTAGFRADVQYLLASGVMVMAPNVRGSSGYGRRYQEMDDRHLRMDSVKDLHAVRGWLDRDAQVDTTRIGVFGRSYGGFMVLAALTGYPESWKLGIDFYGIANFHTLLQTTGPWRRALRAAEYGDPVADAELLTSLSPIHRMEHLAAPLLIVHGMDDPRVTPGESEMLYSVLRGLAKPVRLVRIDHEGHGFARRDSRHIAFGALAEFIERHL